MFHAETKFGEAIIGEAGALATPNTNLLFPLPGRNDTAITSLLYLHALNERFSLVAGKINSLDFWSMFYPNVGRGLDGFMNLNSLAAGMPWLRYVQLSENAAGILAMKGQQPQGAFVVFDPRNSSTTSGLDDMFENGAAMLGIWRFFTDWIATAAGTIVKLVSTRCALRMFPVRNAHHQMEWSRRRGPEQSPANLNDCNDRDRRLPRRRCDRTIPHAAGRS